MARIKTQVGAATALLTGGEPEGDGQWSKPPFRASAHLRFDLRDRFKAAVELSKRLGIDPPESEDLEDLHKFERAAIPLLNKEALEHDIKLQRRDLRKPVEL